MLCRKPLYCLAMCDADAECPRTGAMFAKIDPCIARAQSEGARLVGRGARSSCSGPLLSSFPTNRDLIISRLHRHNSTLTTPFRPSERPCERSLRFRAKAFLTSAQNIRNTFAHLGRQVLCRVPDEHGRYVEVDHGTDALLLREVIPPRTDRV